MRKLFLTLTILLCAGVAFGATKFPVYSSTARTIDATATTGVVSEISFAFGGGATGSMIITEPSMFAKTVATTGGDYATLDLAITAYLADDDYQEAVIRISDDQTTAVTHTLIKPVTLTSCEGQATLTFTEKWVVSNNFEAHKIDFVNPATTGANPALDLGVNEDHSAYFYNCSFTKGFNNARFLRLRSDVAAQVVFEGCLFNANDSGASHILIRTASGEVDVTLKNTTITTGTDPWLEVQEDGSELHAFNGSVIPSAMIEATVTNTFVVEYDSSSNVTETGGGAGTVTFVMLSDAARVQVGEIGTATYGDVQSFIDNTQTAGLISGGEVTENAALDGTIDIAAATGYIRSAASDIGALQSFDIAASTAVAVATYANFIYVDYNAGTPVYATTATQGDVNGWTKFMIARVWKDDDAHLHMARIGNFIADIFNKTQNQLLEVNGPTRSTGIVTTESTDASHDRGLTVTGGNAWNGLRRHTLEARDSLLDHTITGVATVTQTFELTGDYQSDFCHGCHILIGGSTGNDGVYHVQSVSYAAPTTSVVVEEVIPDATADGHMHYQAYRIWYNSADVGWDEYSEAEVFLSNTLYNDATQNQVSALQTLANNRYGVYWVFISGDNDIEVVWGQASYTLGDAENAQIPGSLPDYIVDFTMPIAKVIVLKSATNLLSIVVPWDLAFGQSSVANHNDLGSLQGGTADEYYHWTSADYGNRFLRSGTVAMTGDLDMGNGDITGVNIIAGSGASAVTFESDVAMNNEDIREINLLKGNGADPIEVDSDLSMGLTFPGMIYGYSHMLEANTAGSGAPNELLAIESSKTLTNEGATAANYHTLPGAGVGATGAVWYEFICQDSDGIRIVAASGDTIRVGATVSPAAGYIRSSTIGSVVRVKAINTTEWIVTHREGSWIVGP